MAGFLSECMAGFVGIPSYVFADYDYLTSTFWSVIEWRWQMYIRDSGIIFKTTNFGSRTLVNLMEKIPILDTLHPIDYTNLEGRFLSEPSKSFAVLGSIVAEAQSRTEHGGVACVTDDDVTRVIGDVTGLASSLVRPITFETRRQQALEVAEGLSFDQTTLVEAVEDIYLPMIQMGRPMAVFCVQDRTKRRALAGRLAKSLFGSGSAILILETPTLSTYREPRPGLRSQREIRDSRRCRTAAETTPARN